MTIHHLVLLELNELSAALEAEVFVRLDGLLRQIPGVIDVKTGRNFSDRTPNISRALVVTMKDKQSLAGYGPHPKHVEGQGILKPYVKSLSVVDFET